MPRQGALLPVAATLLLLAASLLSGCGAPASSPSSSTSRTSVTSPDASSATSGDDGTGISTPSSSPPGPEPVAPWSPIAWTPIPCDKSGVRAMPRNAPPAASTNGSSHQVVSWLAAALGLTVEGSDPLAPTEQAYASQAWRLSRGRVVEHVAAETGDAIQWSYLGRDRATGAAWVRDASGMARALLRDLGGPTPSPHEVNTANSTEVLLTFILPLDLGEITLLQVYADVYGPAVDDGSLQVRLHPLHHVATENLERDRSALTTAARDFMECWAPQRSNYRSDWSRSLQPPYPVIRGDGLRLRVPYLFTTETGSCFVTVDVDAQTGAIWDVDPNLAHGAPLEC